MIEHASLRERNYGVLEGRTFPEILEHHPHEAEQMRLRSATHTIANGESQQTFFRRVVDAVTAIARPSRTPRERAATTARRS